MASKNKFKWYGLTGGWSTGKSSVGWCLKQKGVPVLSADSIVYKLYNINGAAFDPICQEFGHRIRILHSNGNADIDRQKLAQIVFQDPKKMKKLEGIVHPLVQAQVQREKESLQAQGFALAFYELPLLFEKNKAHEFDAVVVVRCEPEQQIKRLQARTGLGLRTIKQRLKTQWPVEKKCVLADYVVDNTGVETELDDQVQILLRKLKRRTTRVS